MVADFGSYSSSGSETQGSVDADVTITNVAKSEIKKQAPLANLAISG